MSIHIYTRNQPLLRPHFLRFVHATLLEEGYTNEQIMHGLNFRLEDLQNEKYRLSIEQHEQFLLQVINMTGDNHLALSLSRRFDPQVSGVVILAAVNSGKVSNALHLIARYNKVITRTISIRTNEMDTNAVIEIVPTVEHEAVIYFAISNFALFIDRLFSTVLNDAHLVQKMEMSIPEPDGFASVRDEIGFPVTFNHSTTRLHLNQTLLDRSTRQADPHTVRLLMQMSERQLEEAEAEDSIVGSVASLLIDLVSSPPKLDEAARMLGLSPRSLRRKLGEAGTTFQQQLDQVRLRMAIKLLTETDEPIYSIAYELGFENASHFGRAFKKWTGKSPSSYRHS